MEDSDVAAEPTAEDEADEEAGEAEPDETEEGSEEEQAGGEADAPSSLLVTLATLTVRAEQPRAGYDRSLFRHWVDADGDGCDTRREVLIAEAVTAPTIGAGCAPIRRPLAQRLRPRHRNRQRPRLRRGPSRAARRSVGVGGLGLVARRSRALRQRSRLRPCTGRCVGPIEPGEGARDPAEWLPPDESAHCWYAAAWITVKVRWDLTVDSAEADTLRSLIAGCDGDPAEPAPADPLADPPAEPEPEPKPVGPTVCHPAYDPCLPDLPGDALNCGDLTPAQRPVRVRVIGVDPYRIDRDGNGLGCTS